jgi:bifunctional non-homologous end joining protein LigD
MLQPMLASLADAPLDDPQLVYEPKYDGIRAIAEVPPRGRGVRLWSRLGNEKTSQFPEVVAALERWGRSLEAPVVIDGEIVALDGEGRPTGFQQLQGRIHLTTAETHPQRRGRKRGEASFRPPGGLPSAAPASAAAGNRSSVAYIAFDLLSDGARDLRDRPLLARRAALEQLFAKTGSPVLRLSEMVRGDGRALYKRALDSGWEGLIAKHIDSLYKSGKRTPDWRKLKIVHEQEFVIGGWTEPRQTRTYFGALLLGVYEPTDDVERRGRKRRGGSIGQAQAETSASSASSAVGALVYVGHTGTGFNERELARVMKLLQPLETKECPFRERPKTNERPHWVKPALVAQIKFTEWTADNKLRHPVYLGLRDDKDPREVHREEKSRLHVTTSARWGRDNDGRDTHAALEQVRLKPDPAPDSDRLKPDATKDSATRSTQGSGSVVGSGVSRISKNSRAGSRSSTAAPSPKAVSRISADLQTSLLDQLRAIEESRRDGTITLPDGDTLAVTNLHKIFWPRQKFTKGDLYRYYVQAAPFLLPAVLDRPLVMKRFPNGIKAKPFYQHRVEDVPRGVRVETVSVAERRPQLVGGHLKTLLYMCQLAAISQDPWFSRVQSPAFADYVALDLDPAPGVAFGRVLDVARWIRDELQSLGAPAVPKTSGSEGMHIYIPLPPETPYDAGLLFCQIIATVVSQKHPREATIERAVAGRGRRVYVDYLQNIQGKTLATAYSARASDYAGVSTPLTWKEVDEGVAREDFTIRSVPARLREVGDLWEPLRRVKPVDLARVTRYAQRRTHRRT